MDTAKLNRLTEEQAAFFEREGYLVVNDVFEVNDLSPLREEMAGIIDNKINELLVDGVLKPEESFPEADFDHRLALIAERNVKASAEIIKILEGNMSSGYTGKALFETIVSTKLLSVVEDLIGPEILGSSAYYVRPKLPINNYGVVPWHQDSGYFLAHCDQTLIITCWLPLVNATLENGCLTILPRSHKGAVLLKHHQIPRSGLVIRDEDLPAEDESVVVPVPLGGAIFFTNKTPHCSTPNHSDIVRWSFDLRFQSTDSPNNVSQQPEDYNADAPDYQISCWPPEADFIIKSNKKPEHVIDTYEKFKSLRQAFQTQFPLSSSSFKRQWPPLH